jgi:hypothetical protein
MELIPGDFTSMATLTAATQTTQTNGPIPQTYPAALLPVLTKRPASSATFTTISIDPSTTNQRGSAPERQITTMGANTDKIAAGALSEYKDKLLASKAKLAI